MFQNVNISVAEILGLDVCDSMMTMHRWMDAKSEIFFHFPPIVWYMKRFAGTDPNSKDNSVGLQLLGIVMANNLPPYDAACGIEHDR